MCAAMVHRGPDEDGEQRMQERVQIVGLQRRGRDALERLEPALRFAELARLRFEARAVRLLSLTE